MKKELQEDDGIHFFRKRYNQLIKDIKEIDRKRIHGKYISYYDAIYNENLIPEAPGKVCNICGMSKLERKIIIDFYRNEIKKRKKIQKNIIKTLK